MHKPWPDNPETLNRGERSAAFPPFFLKQYNCIFYFIFKWKEENIQAQIDIITTKSNNSSYVQVCYYHISTHEHGQLYTMNTAEVMV